MKRNKLLILAFLGLCVFGLTGCAKREIKNINSKGTSIICFGDSITFGYGANPGEDFPTQLGKLLGREVINAGVSGDTSTEGMLRLDKEVLERDPLLVLIEFGGNDFIKKVSREATIKNTREFIRRIQARGAMVAIVDISAGLFLRDYRLLFAKIAREEGCIFIPAVLTKLITNPSMKSDFLHPNAAGYKIVAQRIAEAIRPFLSQNAKTRALDNLPI
ncbi:MAG: GDSL-type esterase/lipase family protein [Candidatus Omnitrophica bacterium]|nr:GDSL-type esterase/lipase family protein [Candidatus Omnitrophota bacterium]